MAVLLGLPVISNKVKCYLGKIFLDKTEICTRFGDSGGGEEVERIRTICAVISAVCSVVGLVMLIHYNHLLVRTK